MVSTSILCPPRGTHDRPGRQQALIDAANAVFAEHGYDAATTREVAARAGCSEGLIHRYFGSKRGLLVAILESKADAVTDEMLLRLGEPVALEDDLVRILDCQLDLMWERRDFMRVSVSQAVIDPELGRFVGTGINERRVALITERLQRHRLAGRIRPDVDLSALANSLTALGFSLGFMAQVVFEMGRAQVRGIALQMAKTMAAGVGFAAEDQ